MPTAPSSLALAARRATAAVSLLALLSCTGGPRPATARDLVGPCVACSPESYCSSLVRADERSCASDDDCDRVRVTFPDTRCEFGWYGASFSVVAARRSADAVRARLSALDPCAHRDKVRYGVVCRAPPIACVRGACAYREGPAEHAL